MQKWVALLLLWGLAWPAMAAKTVSVAGMEHRLASLKGKRDGKVAAKLDDVELMQRVSQARLARWEMEFPGKRARRALMKVADLSAFLSPPKGDVLSDPAPDTQAEKHMLALAVQYVSTAMPGLPNFYATRVTTHFEDAVSRVGGLWVGEGAAGLRWTGVSRRTVTYRDGREVGFARKRKRKKVPALGLTTSGEFGPVMVQVLVDALHGGVRFLRWERAATGPAAVFGYSVPANKSHFPVRFITGGQNLTLFPAYHGEIEIDPNRGAILRVSEVADMAPPHQRLRAAIEVNYAPVTVGGRSYILPVRSVALSKIPVATYRGELDTIGRMQAETETNPNEWPVQTDMNDVAFVRYHQFRATVRIVQDPSKLGRTKTYPAPAAVPQR